MFNYIEGKLTVKEENYIVVETGGIGFEIFVSNSTLASIEYVGEVTKVLTYMQVKEDGIILFGFISQEEKSMFLKLISVNGIGPKMAMGILSSISLANLINAIMCQDLKMLTTVKGLGKKTAERLLVELKDKDMPSTHVETQSASLNQNYIDEATDALVSLGVGRNEAYRLAKEYATENASVEEIITNVLRGMGR